MSGTIREVVILSAARTPIGRFQGGLAPLSATDLGGIAVREALRARAGSKAESVDEVLMGHVLQGGMGQAPARQAALKGGLPDTVAATDDQQGLRLGAEGRHARRAPRSRRGRGRRHRRRRHGEHVERPDYLLRRRAPATGSATAS